MSDQEKWVAIKEIIDAMQTLEEPQRQFLLGYAAGASARASEKESA